MVFTANSFTLFHCCEGHCLTILIPPLALIFQSDAPSFPSAFFKRVGWIAYGQNNITRLTYNIHRFGLSFTERMLGLKSYFYFY